MHQEASRYFDATSEILGSSTCACSECDTAFCVARRDHEPSSCKECKTNDPPMFYFRKGSHQNAAEILDHTKSSVLKYIGLGENSTEISNALYKPTPKGSRINHNAENLLPKIRDFHLVSKENDAPKTTSTTTAQLSAQIMNVSYKEFKESVSVVNPEKNTYNTNDIFKRIKEAYDACSCKICECITGKSIQFPNDDCGCSPCDCEPCNCRDCKDALLNIGIDPRVRYFPRPATVLERLTGFIKQDDNSGCSCKPCNCDACTYKGCNKDLLNIAIESRMNGIKKSIGELKKVNSGLSESDHCDCKPCDCIKCYKKYSKSCDCKPCQCYECQSMRGIGRKTVIVAPVGEGTQRANCLCAPCDCARCSHRGLNLSPNRVHEMSTGINRHPNCHCEACVDDSCEPNGTGSCRCEGRHGVISKPVENNPHDYDIRRATVSSKPMKATVESRFIRNSTFVAMNTNKFPPGKGKDFNKQSCKCDVCECIVCKCKGNDFSSLSKSSHNMDDSLRTLKLPSRELKNCQCAPCECEYCSMKKKAHFSESTEFKSCTCQNCDCLHCEGELKPRHTLSKLIPVMGTGSRERCQCKPCECNDCKKMVTSRNVDPCHCDLCRCEHCSDEANASREALYPIKKGEILTPSMIRKNPLSQSELLSKSSEYTHIKPSMAQSNVFNPSTVPEKSQQNFTIFHMVRENDLKETFNPAVPLQSANQRKINTNTKSRNAKILGPNKEDLKNWSQFYCASTSKTVTENSSHENDKMFESSFNNEMMAISNLSRGPSILSIPPSTHNLVYLTGTSDSGKPSYNLSMTSSNRNPEISVKTLRKPIEIKLENVDPHGSRVIEAGNLELNRCHHCGSSYANSELIKETCNVITQTSFANVTNYNNHNDVFEDPVLKYLLSDNSESIDSLDNITMQAKYTDGKDNNDYGAKNKYHTWRFQHTDSHLFNANNADMPLHTESAPYESALMTLKRAKEFSLELVTLLNKYDKANSEFESISKKLKKSHESMLNELKNGIYSRSYVRTSSVKNYDDYLKSNNNAPQTIFHHSKNFTINDQFWSPNKDNLKDNVSLPLITENRRNHPDNKENVLKQLNELKKNYVDANKAQLEPEIKALKTPPLAIRVNILENKSSKPFSDSNNNKVLVSENPHERSITTLSPTHESKIELCEKENEKAPSGYKAYKKLVTRSAGIAKKLKLKNSTLIDDGCDAVPIGAHNTVETDLLKKIIRQEIQGILKQFGEIKKPPTSTSSAPVEEHKVKNALFKREKPIKIKYDAPVSKRSRQLVITTTKNKPTVKSKESVNGVPQQEATDDAKVTPSTQTSAAPARQSSHMNTALKKLQNEVKELLNMAMLHTASTAVLKEPSEDSTAARSCSVMVAQTAAPVVNRADDRKIAMSISKSKLKKGARRRPVDYTIVLAKYPKSDSSVPIGNKNCACEDYKATSLNLRRVSDHTVMMKWEVPKNIQDIRGFEVLVDGKPVEKLFGPSERMAVVTCLPHCERVQLAVRSVARVACGHDICRAALYRPRDKQPA